MKKRTPQGIVLIVVLGLAFFMLNKYFLNHKDTPSINEILNIRAHDLNKNLPIDIDENTRFDIAICIPERQLQLNYTLHNITNNNFDVKTLVDSTGLQLLTTIKKDPNLKLLRDHDVIFSFQYSDTLGHIIHKFTFKSKDYR